AHALRVPAEDTAERVLAAHREGAVGAEGDQRRAGDAHVVCAAAAAAPDTGAARSAAPVGSAGARRAAARAGGAAHLAAILAHLAHTLLVPGGGAAEIVGRAEGGHAGITALV